MHIAIDVNDPSVAQKILHYLKSFKNEIAVDAFENDEEFEKNKQSLHTIYNSIKNSPENLHTLDTDFWDEMDSAIKMLKTIQRSESFKKSLLGILTFIAKDSKNKANIFKKALQEKINQLTFMPFKYRKSIYFEDENIRDFIFKGYCIPYVIDEENEKIILLDIIKYEKR